MPEAYQDNEVIMEGYKKIKKYVIPNDWDLIKLGDLTTKVGSGKTPKGGEAVYQSSGIPFIRSQNVLDNKLELSNVSFISESVHDEMKSTKVKANDVLLNITGASIGRCCVVPEDFIEGNINQHVCIIRPKANLNEIYLSYVLQSTIGQRQIFMNQAGGNREGLNFEQIRKFDIPFPNLKEQRKIANVLSIWDKAIELKEKLIEQKKEQKKGLMQLLISGNIRIPGFSFEWSKKNVGELIEESKEVAKHPKLSERITVRLSLKGVTKRETTTIEKDGATTQYVRRAGQFIYGKQNLHKGAIGLIPKELDEFQSSSDIPAFDFKEGVEPLWFYYYFARENFYESLEGISSGTGSKRIQPKELYKVKIIVPSVEEQKKQSEIFVSLDKEINLLHQELNLLKSQKQALMQQLLTGKIRVKV